MQNECDKLYDGAGHGTVFTDANGEAVIDYLKDWDNDEWSKDDICDEEPQWVNKWCLSLVVVHIGLYPICLPLRSTV